MEFSFQQFICKQKSNLKLKINEGQYESDKFFFSKNYPSFQADVFRRRKFDFYHAILYQSHCYIYLLFNWLSYLLNQLNPPLNGKLYKRTENISFIDFSSHETKPVSPRIAIDSYFWNPKKENISIIGLTIEWYWP